jgi:hypothetical protein
MRLTLLLLSALTLAACAAAPPPLSVREEYFCRLFDSTVKPTCTPADLVAEIQRSYARRGYVGPGNYPGHVNTDSYKSTYDMMMAPFPQPIRIVP